MRKHKVEIALLLLVPALAIWLFIVDKGSVTTKEAEIRKRNLLKAFRREQIERVVFERGEESYHLKKHIEDGDSMYYVERRGHKEEIADQTAVDRLLSILEFAVPERKVDDPIDRAALGLDAPRLRMKLDMGKVAYELALGGEAPSPKGAAYAELEGTGVLVLPRDLVTQLVLSAHTYRSRTLIPYLSPDLSKLDIDGPGGERHLVRGSWGGWELEGEPRVRADREVLDRILFAFADIRAEAFLSDEEADRALSEEPVTITMVPRDEGRPRGLLQIGGECPENPSSIVAIRREPSRISACVPKGVMPALSTPREALVDKRLFSFRPDEIEQIVFEEGERKLEVARKGAGWKMRAPSDADVEVEAGNLLAKAIHGLEASRVVEAPNLEALGLSKPRGKATLSRALEAVDEPGATEVVELGLVRGDVAYVRRQTDGTVLEVGRELLRTIEPNAMALKSRAISDISQARIKKISIEAGDFRQVLSRSEADHLRLEAPSSFDTDGALAIEIAEALGQLRADRWVAEGDDGSFGFAKPRAIYELVFAAERDAERDEKLRIVVGAPTQGGHFAKKEGSPGVFVLPRAISRRAETYAIDRGILAIEPSEIQKLTVRAPGKGVTLRRAGDRLVAEGEALSKEAAARIVESVGALRAVGTVRLGGPRKEEGFDRPQLELEIERLSPLSVKPETVKITVGAGDDWEGASVFYARRAGLEASFALPQRPIRAILDAI